MAMTQEEIKKMPKLGFGMMRLPRMADGKTIDVEETKEMVDLFMKAGLKYFDTAYVYDGGESEKVTGEALVKRYPRDSYYLATKLNAGIPSVHDVESARQQFFTSLDRTGAGYFDFYLLHALQTENYKKYDEYKVWEFAKELKEKGLIRHYGFSFHAGPGLLDELLTKHPDVDFIQLQINYVDMENPNIESRANMEVAIKHGIPVTIMEPIKGGSLARLVPDAEKVLKRIRPDMSIASWALRFAASQDNSLVVLSGMSNIEQMKDNLSYMADFKPLDDKEMEAIDEVVKILNSTETIACTKCHYCTDGCPVNMPIPDIFEAENLVLRDNKSVFDAKKEYDRIVKESGVKASECIECGQCESACPQHLPIIKLLKDGADMFEWNDDENKRIKKLDIW